MIHFNNPDHAFEIASRAGVPFNPAVDQCISREENGEVMGGALYSGYTGESINAHMAGFHPNWVNRDMLWVCFHYPFVKCDCRRMFGQVPETNTRALEFNRKLGFNILTVIPGVFVDGGVYVICMERSDCRWLRLKPTGFKEVGDGW